MQGPCLICLVLLLLLVSWVRPLAAVTFSCVENAIPVFNMCVFMRSIGATASGSGAMPRSVSFSVDGPNAGNNGNGPCPASASNAGNSPAVASLSLFGSGQGRSPPHADTLSTASNEETSARTNAARRLPSSGSYADMHTRQGSLETRPISMDSRQGTVAGDDICLY